MAQPDGARRPQVRGDRRHRSVHLDAVLEMLKHLRLVGVFDLEPFTLCVISGGCVKIYLKHTRWMQAVRAVLWNGDGAAVGERYENLMLIGRVVMRDEWS